MKAIIFAGGTGTRLWPLSRKKSPKQFEKIVGDKSTLQLAVERLMPEFKAKDIYVSTNINYKEIVVDQLPYLSKENFLFEPEKKDVAPAIALAMAIIGKKNLHEPVAILWSDHLIKRVKLFKKLLITAGKFISSNPHKIILIGHKPRYVSVNLGYIHLGREKQAIDGVTLYQLEGYNLN